MAHARDNVKDHATKMLSELHRMQQEKDHCDFVIKVQNEVYHTHKNVLSAGSEYFRAMLAHDTKESRDGEMTFKDADSECVKSCVDFIYSGEFQVPTGKIKELLHIGIMLRLDGVCSILAEILTESLNAENYYFTTKIADMYQLTGVRSKCKQYYAKNLMEIANQTEFGNVAVSKLNNLLKADKLNYTEEEKLTIFLKWAEKNPEDKDVLLESIKRFRLDKMSSAFLRNILKTHPIVSNDLMIYKLISDHLFETLEKKNGGTEGESSVVTTEQKVTRRARYKRLNRYGDGTTLVEPTGPTQLPNRIKTNTLDQRSPASSFLGGIDIDTTYNIYK